MAQNQMQAPDNLFYIRLTIDEVNKNPNAKNILKMQQSIFCHYATTRSLHLILSHYDEKVSSFKVSEALQERRMPFFKKEKDKY